MTLLSNANTWTKATVWSIGAVVGLVLWSWSAGCVFMLLNKTLPKGVWPHTYWQYLWYYYQESKVLKQLLLSGVVPVVAAAVAIFKLTRTERPLHGAARFANAKEIAQAGLLKGKGIIVGHRNGKFLMSDGPLHVILAAPTRSGKGVGVVIPNLLNWADSVVVLDIKQENWELTAGFRQKYGQQCFLFNPSARDLRTACWNPLAYVSRDPNFRVDDLQKIASMLWPDNLGGDAIWDQLAASLFLGIALYIMDTPDLPFTIGECLRQSMKPDIQKRLKKIISERQQEGRPLQSQCVHALTSFASGSDKTASSVLMTYQAKLSLWLNPVIDAATSGNDFDLRDLRRKRTSVYLGITPDDLKRLAPLVNLFFQQVIDLQMRARPEQDKSLKYHVLLLMDEFTSMGKVEVLTKSIAYVAGYGLRLLPIIQSTSQLHIYGEHEKDNFVQNMAVRIIYTPEDIKIAKELSETLGYETVTSTNISKERGFSAKRGKHNESESQQRRALLLPQELLELPQDKAIILHRGIRPAMAGKIRYYQRPEFTSRLLPPPSVQPITLDSHEAEHDVTDMPMDATAEQVRPLTAEDIESLNSLSLRDFSCDFSDIEIPNDPVSDEDLNNLVDAFFNRIEKAADATAA